MSRNSQQDLVPRNGQTLEVCVVCRISGCQNQKEASLDDQQDNAKDEVRELYAGPASFHIIATKGKGERLDRPELLEIEEAYRSGRFDLFVFDDLSRLIRGGEAAKLLGIGVDNGTRTICINDGIDTADGTWEEDALNACSENVAHNERTSKRLKQKLKNRFKKFGGAMARPIFGYIVTEEAKTYDDWRKDLEAEPWIVEGKARLKESLNCSAVAAWFNANQVATGPYCDNSVWDGAMIRRFYGNPLLKGMPQRGATHTVKKHEKGRRIAEKNPEGPVYYECPHLAYLEPVEFDELNALLDQKNAKSGRKPVDGNDPLLGRARKRTRFPGQYGRCFYCGRIQVWGGNGVTENLMCSGSRRWLCWNSVGYNGQLAVARLTDVISRESHGLDGFADQYREIVAAAVRSDPADIVRRREKLAADQAMIARQQSNMKEAVAEYGLQPWIRDKMNELKVAEAKANAEHRELERAAGGMLVLPPTTDELRGLFEQTFAELAHDSFEFGSLLQKIVVDFRVYLVRLCDGGGFLPRAKAKLAFDGLIPDARQVPGLSALLYREATLNLFEPTQREQIREESARLAATGLGPKAIAATITLPDGKHPTDTAVQRALKLHQRMLELNLTSPYVLVTDPPEDCGRLRRHKNAGYHFQPLEGYERPAL